jgi:NADH dehydrogenase
MTNPVRVVCLGGGYTANFLAKSLRSAIKKKQVQLTIIDKNNFQVFQGLVPEMVAGKIMPSTVTCPSRRIVVPAQFYNAVIESVDWINRIVTVSRTLDGQQFYIPYDHLVISLGFTDNLLSYPGLSENAFRLRMYNDSFQLRNHIPLMLELAELENDPQERRRLLTFIIAGGNYAGVEIATELVTYTKALIKKEFRGLSKEHIQIILVHSGSNILPELGKRFPQLADYAASVVKKLGIELQCDTSLVSATPEEAITNKGEHIPTRTIISCTGTALNPLVDAWDFERNQSGRIKTDEYLNVIGQTNIWAGGDCAAIPHPKSGTCPPLALYAMTAGKVIGKNILRNIKNEKLQPYRFTSFGDICSLSKHTGVGQLFGLPIKGFGAWLIWRVFMLCYLPTLDRRLHLLSDWFISAIVGRDIISIQDSHKLMIAKKFYEEGQAIIREGEIGNAMYFINHGVAEVVKMDKENKITTVLATLKEGSHFGEIAVFNQCKRTATVIAKTPITLLEIKRDAAEALSVAFAELKNTEK